ncbi:LysR family transcriptional regulator [Methylosinus sp. H3A]|uniref:LysR family transcriptional regulator n=1 Tax=Methylosinus sp. H3A TaxID=2785786 RepID=UPI002897478F|nr:LysR family transcriptional regulator [Methylosinus sp. H3A]
MVAEYGSFSRAARVLGVGQSAVSRRVKALEDCLGVSLFERHMSGVRLTVAGQRFIIRARAAFAEIELASKGAQAAGRGEEGTIRIGSLPSLASGFFGDLLERYRKTHPRIGLELYEGSAQDQVAMLMERRLDVTFFAEGVLAPSCDAETFWFAGICVAFPHRHPLAGCDFIDWEFVKNEHFILGREALSSGFDRLASDSITKFGGRMTLETHDVSQETVMKLVALGFGLGLVTDTNTSIRYPGVAFRPVLREDSRLGYRAVWLPGNDNPALRRFLSLARSMSAEKQAPKA